MGIRKNAKFLTAPEIENFVKACILMKAEIVNPAAPAADQYSRWDENVAIHWMIQQGIAPGGSAVNFGHGGNGAYSFLSWHRYFLYRVEQQLQSHVPGVMMPYWDWTDPAPIMTNLFMGVNGPMTNEVQNGYFGVDAPGTGSNPTPSPAWWPAGLPGWRLHTAFGTAAGALKRQLNSVAALPPVSDIHNALAKATYPEFQGALEGGGVGFTTSMHNGMHGWVGGPGGQMSIVFYSPFDPFFYLHHCNIDRLWAMWQVDGHATEYPAIGGKPNHNRNDLMFPWVGVTPGYGTSATIASAIPMPDFSALGPKANGDTLDHRAAFGYTYDTIAVIGLGLDRTGSMLGMTPDPMTSGAPDVTKWDAAKRGVSAFFQDCETVQSSGAVYTVAGVKTFRSLGANDFQAVFAAPGYGLIKSGTSFSRSTFDTAVGGMSPGGATPLADALNDVKNTLVTPPFGGVPADENRYLAMLTDGLLTDGSPMSSIPDGSFSPIAVFSMGFGTGLDVDYATLQSMVDKGRSTGHQQVFHSDNVGTVDKFYSNALAAAIGFTTIFDPVIELFAGEHTHLDFLATSADDAFFITAQGIDFDDDNWSFALHDPMGNMVYGESSADGMGMKMDMGCMHCCRKPHVTAKRANGRLSLMLQRDSADAECWVGPWTLMIAYKARRLDGMAMFPLGNLMEPVAAGPSRGPRFSRLLVPPKQRAAQRNIVQAGRHPLDVGVPGTNRNDQQACDMTVNIYARTRLRISLDLSDSHVTAGKEVAIRVNADILQGSVSNTLSFARLVSPAVDIPGLAAKLNPNKIPTDRVPRKSNIPAFDAARALAEWEQALLKKDAKYTTQYDQAPTLAVHENGPLHLHIEKTAIPGPYHVSIYIEGDYCPGHDAAATGGHDHSDHAVGAMPMPMPMPGEPTTCDSDCPPERFSRLLTTMAAVAPAPPPKKK